MILRTLLRPALPAAAFLLAAANLAGCQPLPHPFENQKLPADSALLAMGEANGVRVEPVAGAPGHTGEALATVMAASLDRAEIPASLTSSNHDSYRLSGETLAADAAGGSVQVRLRWTLRDATGRVLGTAEEADAVPAAAWASGERDPLMPLVAEAGPRIAGLIEEKPPVAATGAHRLYIRQVEGAPGDGDTALPRALGYVLGRIGLPVVEPGAPETARAGAISVTGSVTMRPGPAGQQHVAILWRVLGPDGREAGQVAQENDVPSGSLDGSWSDVALAVASAAGDQIARIVATIPGAPSPHRHVSDQTTAPRPVPGQPG